MHHPEPVADEGVTERRELVGEVGADSLVLAGLARVEPYVLQQSHLTVGEAVDHRACRLPHRVGGEEDLGAEELAEASGHGPQ